MRSWRLVLLLIVVAVLGSAITVFAQGGVRTAEAEWPFMSIEHVNPSSRERGMGSQAFVVKIRMSDGAACYALTEGAWLRDLSQVHGLGCVK